MSENEYSYPPDKWANEYTPTMKAADHISAADQRHNDHERRIAGLEMTVHRLLNAEHPHWMTPPNVNEWLAQNNPPFAAAAHPPEADYAHIPAAEWESICAELEALRRKHGIVGSNNDVIMSHEAWKTMTEELESLRSTRPEMDEHGVTVTPFEITLLIEACKSQSLMDVQPGESVWDDLADKLSSGHLVMDERGVLLSHDAYDMLERQAAIGRSVPWKHLRREMLFRDNIAILNDLPIDRGHLAVMEWYADTAPKEAAK